MQSIQQFSNPIIKMPSPCLLSERWKFIDLPWWSRWKGERDWSLISIKYDLIRAVGWSWYSSLTLIRHPLALPQQYLHLLMAVIYGSFIDQTAANFRYIYLDIHAIEWCLGYRIHTHASAFTKHTLSKYYMIISNWNALRLVYEMMIEYPLK